MAEGALWARLARIGKDDQYKLFSAALPTALIPAATAEDRGRDELGNSYVLWGQTLTDERVRQADLILVMSEAERQAVLGHFSGAESKTVLLSAMAGTARDVTGVSHLSRQAFQRLCREVEQLVDAGFETILDRANASRAATMARVGFSTSLFHYEFIPPSLAETLALIKQAGVRFVDWSQDLDNACIYAPAEIEQFAELLETSGLRCQQLHGFENTQVHAVTKGETWDRYVAAQSSRIELCAHLGGDTVVLHLPGLFWGHLGLSLHEAMEHTTLALDRLRPLCERLEVQLAVENYREQSSKERLDFYLDRYPAEFITFCLDTGHANLVSGEMEEMKAYSSRLSALHLTDNRQEEDDHQPPFFGTVDWVDVLDWLQEIDYGRSLSFELIYDRHLFPGSPTDFVGYAVQRARQVLSLNPALTQNVA
jgi:sugar phosphate isomerase/epimerase/protein-tyrosine-phosphatase